MIRKYHNHTLHTNPRHREEEPHNSNCHKTSRWHLKSSNQLTVPRHNDGKIRKDSKYM